MFRSWGDDSGKMRAMSPETKVSTFRFTEADKTRWKAAAEAVGLSLTAFLERAANREAARIERKPPTTDPAG